MIIPWSLKVKRIILWNLHQINWPLKVFLLLIIWWVVPFKIDILAFDDLLSSLSSLHSLGYLFLFSDHLELLLSSLLLVFSHLLVFHLFLLINFCLVLVSR